MLRPSSVRYKFNRQSSFTDMHSFDQSSSKASSGNSAASTLTVAVVPWAYTFPLASKDTGSPSSMSTVACFAFLMMSPSPTLAA